MKRGLEASRTQFVVVTGLSGAGKTEVIRCLEDLGFFCVDNLPPALIPKFADLCAHPAGKVRRVALVTDIRGGAFFDELFTSLAELRKMGFAYRILFLEASDEALVSRFKATRRPHPLGKRGRSLLQSIREERRALENIRGRADKVINTSGLAVGRLKEEISSLFLPPRGEKTLVNIISFGYKYGIPPDADHVFDARFLANPHYEKGLRALTGEDERVARFVLKDPVTKEFLDHLQGFVAFLLPQHRKEGKAFVTIAIGCTGGKHRAPVIARHLGTFLKPLGYRTLVEHRDINRR
jgi:UPF0042 nucleotide-binding protein